MRTASREYRLKADESYQIGEVGHPVRAYLDVEGIIRAAKDAGVDAIYPGYGFLSENPDLAQACEDNGIAFVGPNHRFSNSPATRPRPSRPPMRPACPRCAAATRPMIPRR